MPVIIRPRDVMPAALVSSTQGALTLSCLCSRCSKAALLTLAHGEDGYEVLEVRSHCEHVPDQEARNER